MIITNIKSYAPYINIGQKHQSNKNNQQRYTHDVINAAVNFKGKIPLDTYIANASAKIFRSEKPDFSSFSKWLEKENIPLNKLVEYIETNGRYLGEGTENIVFALPNSDLFAFRKPLSGINGHELREIKDEFPNLNLGQAIAKVGNATIIKLQNGVESGIPYADRIKASGLENTFTYRKHLSRVNQMPQEAYDELAETFAKLNQKEYSFDLYNPNNILIDVDKKKFNIVDDLKEIYDEKEYNTFASITIPLFDTWFVRSLSFTDDYLTVWQKMIEKSMIASKKAGLPEPQKDGYWLDKMFELSGMGHYRPLTK